MQKFNIKKPDEKIRSALSEKIDNLTKPKGSLGMLEDLALKIGMIQQSLNPVLRNPQNVLFAADHGIVEEGVSISPKEVTVQQVLHFLTGKGAGINFLCNQNGFKLKVIDAGVDFDFPEDCGIIDMKVAKGTKNFLYSAAMSKEEMELCIKRGASIVKDCFNEGCNIISFGEMGIGNTSPSSVWMHLFTKIPLERCIGAGSGLDSEGIEKKHRILKKGIENYRGDNSVESIIAWFGGFEMVMAIGGMLQAAELGMIIIIDGFIMTSCILAAKQLYFAVTDYALFGHCGDEAGHKLLLNELGGKPILSLGMRLGEGSGAVCAYPIIQSAVNMINNMDSFKKAVVTKYF